MQSAQNQEESSVEHREEGSGNGNPDDVVDTELIMSDVLHDLARLDAGEEDPPPIDQPPSRPLRLERVPGGRLGVRWPCPGCGHETVLLLEDLASGISDCSECGAPSLSPATATLEDAIENFVYEADWLTRPNPGLALEMAEEVLTANPDVALAHGIAGIVLDERGETGRAVRHFTSGIDLDPENARLHHGLGVALLNLEDVEAAANEFRQALAHYPDYIHAIAKLGLCHLVKEDWVAAALTAYKLRQLDPGGPVANLGDQIDQEIGWRMPRRRPPARSLWRRLTGKPSRRETARWAKFLKTSGDRHLTMLFNALEHLDRGESRQAARDIDLLRSLLPENSDGFYLVCEYTAIAYANLDWHSGAYELSAKARRGLPCVTALAVYPRCSITSLTPDLKTLYRNLVRRLFGDDCPFIYEKLERLRSGVIRRSIALRGKDPSNEYVVRRAGNLVTVTSPPGEEIEYQVQQGSYLAFHGL